LVNEPKISLMHQRCGLEGMPGTFPPEMTRGQLAKLPIYEWRQLLQRLLVAAAPFPEQFSYFVR